MRLIFDNHIQKRHFVTQFCPSEFDLEDSCQECYPECERCWEKVAEIDVEEDEY